MAECVELSMAVIDTGFHTGLLFGKGEVVCVWGGGKILRKVIILAISLCSS